MTIDIAEIYTRLTNVYGTTSMSSLSLALGYQKDWAGKMKSREAIPFDALLKTSLEKGVSFEYLLFGAEQQAPKIEKLSETFLDVVCTGHELDFLKVNPKADLSALANLFVTKLHDN